MMTSAADIRELYAPVAEDLDLVEDALRLVAESDFAPLEVMLTQVLSRGGKRLRPAVALLAGRFGEYDADRQIPLAASIELLHTATLVHDDVIDAADLRRGDATANATFGNPASVMLGDYMFAHAAALVARTGHIGVIRLFADTLMVMAKGELAQDVAAYDAASGNIRDYYRRIHGKTASLFATAGAGGAMMAECAQGEIDALREYGRCLGMAFQIVDDILDFTGSEEQLGKPVGGDLRAGTLTLPAIYVLEQGGGSNPVSAVLSADESERDGLLPTAIEAVRAPDVLAQSEATADEWRDRALAALETVAGDGPRTELREIAAFVTQREW